ncbi:MAG: 4Fe-4S dicluster-binding protein [Planctomycetota bacterium]
MQIKQGDGWKKLPWGGMIPEPGTSVEYKTGAWRSFRPLWNEAVCKQCLKCNLLCPDVSIKVVDGKMKGIDLDYCKGCGICATTCPFKAIEMKNEIDL